MSHSASLGLLPYPSSLILQLFQYFVQGIEFYNTPLFRSVHELGRARLSNSQVQTWPNLNMWGPSQPIYTIRPAQVYFPFPFSPNPLSLKKKERKEKTPCDLKDLLPS